MKNIFNKIFLLAAIILFANGAGAKSPPPGSGTADVPANILLMLDTSGSMGEYITSGDSRYPVDVAFGNSGKIYVAKYYDEVEIYSSAAEYISAFGDFGTANGKFDNTYAIDVDSSGNVYVADQNNGRVQKFDENGTYIAKYTLQSGTDAYGVALDSSNNVYAVNSSGVVEKFSNAGTRLLTFNVSNARHIAIDSSDRIWVTRNSSKRIQRYNTSGTLQQTITTSYNPFGIETDSTGAFYVSDSSGHKVYKYNSSGSQTNVWGSSSGSTSTRFNSPQGIGVKPDDTAWVADYNNHRIKQPSGTLLIDDGNQRTRLDVMKSVIKTIVSDSNLTSGANFGLMTWNSSATMRVNVSDTGASDIYSMIDSLTDGGGTVLDSAMNLASSYFLGTTSPRNASASCQQNILIVISDGYWTDTTASTTAQSLYNNQGIKTFAIGFTTTDNGNYTDVSVAGGSYPDSPLFADNEQSMLDVLSAYIRQILSTQLTFTVPTIVPAVSGSDSILQSTFLFKENHQWKGHLYKYSLNTDGTIGSLLWDAGSLLNQKLAASRNIWTVGTGITQTTNNFTTTNRTRLKTLLEENAGTGYTDDEIDSLINFTRGVDSYSEYPTGEDDEGDTLLTGERWKLADIYHSRAVVVGAPSAYTSDEANSNSEAYYRYQNNYAGFKQSTLCGEVCTGRDEVVYVGSNSGMLHAFNSSTGEELWSFIPPSVLPYLRNAISTTSGRSVSIYGVDGSPIVKDIYYGGAWRTILIAGLRQGANSYFALDVTDPYNPTHLFTIANNTVRSKVSYWNASGTKTDYAWTTPSFPAAYDFRNLGESWSDPVILNVPISGTRKWVAVFGGGYNNNVSSTYGNNLYVIDLEDGGKILNRITLADNDGTNGIVNSVPAHLSLITADTTTTFSAAGGMLYVSDLEGKLWKINLTNQGTLYETTRIFGAESTYTNDRLSYHKLTPSILSNGKIINLFGTGDMQRVGRTSTSIQNRAYGIFDENYPNFTSVTPYTASNLAQITSTSSACPTTSQKGWYFNLDSNEKISAEASVRGGTVIFSRYTPDANNLCDSGSGKISEHDFSCGTTLRETDLGAGMPTEAIVYKDKVYIGISSDAELTTSLPTGFVKTGNLIVGNPVVDAPTTVRIQNWKEN
jgi:type IV pilus assembly protein PilY1